MMPRRVVIATPMTDLSVSGPMHAATWEIVRGDVEIIDPRVLTDMDLSKARARAVRLFLTKSEGTHLLFWDGDVVGNAECLRNMLNEGVDHIAATYPKKTLDVHGLATEFAFTTRGKPIAFEGWKATGDSLGVGLGFTLLTRELLARMWLKYQGEGDGPDDLGAYDMGEKTVMMFHLSFGRNGKGQRVENPEDFSFCERVRGAGSAVHLYTGPASPLPHLGPHLFKPAQPPWTHAATPEAAQAHARASQGLLDPPETPLPDDEP